MTDEKIDTSSSRPFQLRPSILSGTGLGNPFAGDNAPLAADKESKGFTLRPSALTSAADQLESLHKTDSKKRPLDSNTDLGDEIQNEKEDSKKIKVSVEDVKATIQLTEDIKKPTGIGTFGFAEEDKADGVNGAHDSPQAKVNYFQQGLDAKSEKLTFGFAAKTGSSFSDLKKENTDTKIDLSANNEVLNGAENEKNCKDKLLENADEYVKSHNQQQHFEEVEQFTGEEGEQHVLQVFCKLHLFDKDKRTWVEKGRGTLKLNDICQSQGVFQSRLVFRTQGTNIVQLNTMLWAEMSCEMVKEKSVRLTAVDPETREVKVYLITTGLKDTLQIYTAIDRRIVALIRNKNKETTSVTNDDASNGNDSKSRSTDDENSNESTNAQRLPDGGEDTPTSPPTSTEEEQPEEPSPE